VVIDGTGEGKNAREQKERKTSESYKKKHGGKRPERGECHHSKSQVINGDSPTRVPARAGYYLKDRKVVETKMEKRGARREGSHETLGNGILKKMGGGPGSRGIDELNNLKKTGAGGDCPEEAAMGEKKAEQGFGLLTVPSGEG